MKFYRHFRCSTFIFWLPVMWFTNVCFNSIHHMKLCGCMTNHYSDSIPNDNYIMIPNGREGTQCGIEMTATDYYYLFVIVILYYVNHVFSVRFHVCSRAPARLILPTVYGNQQRRQFISSFTKLKNKKRRKSSGGACVRVCVHTLRRHYITFNTFIIVSSSANDADEQKRNGKKTKKINNSFIARNKQKKEKKKLSVPSLVLKTM